MPACVHIPVRIRVDAKTVYARCGCIEDALTKAAGRALANSKTVLSDRGGYAGVCLYTPKFNWTGDGLSEVPISRRLELEQRWADILVRAADEAGLTDYVREWTDSPRPIPPNPSEPFDFVRATGDGYQVPSYGDDEESEGPVTWNPNPPSDEELKAFLEGSKSVNIGSGIGFRDYSAGGDLGGDWEDKTIELLGAVPESGYLGALYRRGGDFFVQVAQFPGGVPVANIKLSPIFVKAKSIESGSAGGFSPTADYEVAWFQNASTPDEWREAVFAFMREQVKTFLREKRKKPHEDSDVRAVTDEVVAQGVSPGTVGFAVFRINGFDEYLIAALPNWPKATFRVIPLAFYGEGSTGSGKGGKGGAAGGTRGGTKTGTPGGHGVEGGSADGLRPCCVEPVKVPTVTIDGIEYDWGPFECEPPMYQLGKNGDYMRELMSKLASKLNIPECEYAAQFCIQATYIVGYQQYGALFQAYDGGEGELKAAPGGKGNLGAVHFQPTATQSILTLRDLAANIPEISHLQAFTQMTYAIPEYSNLLGKWYTGNTASWELRLIPAMSDAMNQSIGRMFITACNSVLMQLFRASRTGIVDRMGNEIYAAQFEQLIKNEILPLDYLKRLRDQLAPWVPKSIGQAVGEYLFTSWEQARDRVRDTLEGRNPYGDVLQGLPGSIVRDGGTTKIKDSEGALWSIDDLDAEIALRTAVAEGIDPLVVQITSDRHILDRFARNPNNIRGELATLLKEMLAANKDKMEEAQENSYFAFGASKIYESATRFSGTAGSGYDLTGLHKQANDLIVESFKGDSFYRHAIKNLFDTEEGKRSLLGFFEFAGVIFLCVVCAPLGVAAGIATAIYHEHEALEEQKLFRSLLYPEAVLTRAELETDLFCAELSLALSFIPEGGKIAEGAVSGGRALLKKELKTAITALGEAAAKGIAKEVLKSLEKGILTRFITEFIKAQLISQFVGKLVIGPVAERISADFSRTLEAKAVLGGE